MHNKFSVLISQNEFSTFFRKEKKIYFQVENANVSVRMRKGQKATFIHLCYNSLNLFLFLIHFHSKSIWSKNELYITNLNDKNQFNRLNHLLNNHTMLWSFVSFFFLFLVIILKRQCTIKITFTINYCLKFIKSHSFSQLDSKLRNGNS